MATATKTWRQKATADAITRKVNRKKNPVRTYTQLAQELGAPVYANYWGTGGSSTSSSFRTHVKQMAGNVFSNN